MIKVFIDLDGVLADFFGSVCQFAGHNPKETIKLVTPEKDFIDQLTKGDFWNNIDESFWTGMKETEDARLIMTIVRKHIPEKQIGILTSAAKRPSAASGKVKWVNQHFPELSRRLIITNSKYLCACRDSVLLDDWEKQVEAFREAGGHGLLIGRPWNTGTPDPDYKWLDKSFDLIKRGIHVYK